MKNAIEKLTFAVMVTASVLQASPLIGQATMQAPVQQNQTPYQQQPYQQYRQAPPQAPAQDTPQASSQTPVFPQKAGGPDKQTIAKYVADSQKAVDAWLALSDSGKYGESWDAGGSTFKMTISRKEWIQAMEALRKPLGEVKSRKIIDIGNAENPRGLPEGEYMVYFYDTQFSNPGKNQELLTLSLERDGQWRLLTYQALGK